MREFTESENMSRDTVGTAFRATLKKGDFKKRLEKTLKLKQIRTFSIAYVHASLKAHNAQYKTTVLVKVYPALAVQVAKKTHGRCDR